ncbi:hypothetical protein SCLCIDRAFT_25549 [Scleroderma citrinum Foug A]|uniref:Uncharacterized protein n=1 Tax=Scleroderma citrinum Foug A TaxID=1036808 RepID=A0A0C3E1C4_9AGAM|nr:hypothetical protein SCLCIDRAFT_25549 [Scleroderma citrinum Foug A]
MEATMAAMQSVKGAVKTQPVKPKPRVRQSRPTSISTARDDGASQMEVDTYPAPISPTYTSGLTHKPSSNGMAARGNIRALKRHNAMATLADVAVEEQESARVQKQLEVLLHQLCVLFGLLIMLLLTESTLYWLNRIWTPRPPNKRALLFGRVNNWSNEVEADNGDGTPPNTLASNS